MDYKQIFLSFPQSLIEKRLKNDDYKREYEMLSKICNNMTVAEIANDMCYTKERIKQCLKKCVDILQETPSEKEQKLIDFAKNHLVELNTYQKKWDNYVNFCSTARDEINEAEKNIRHVGRFRVRRVGAHAVSQIANQHEKSRILLKNDVQEIRMKLKNKMIEEGLYSKHSQFDALTSLHLYNYYN